MRHRHRGLSTYGLNGRRPGDEHPRVSLQSVEPFTLPVDRVPLAEAKSINQSIKFISDKSLYLFYNKIVYVVQGIKHAVKQWLNI